MITPTLTWHDGCVGLSFESKISVIVSTCSLVRLDCCSFTFNTCSGVENNL